MTTTAAPENRSMQQDVRYLLGTFSPADRRRFALTGVVQFILAAMDLLGVAAILPLMQIMMGAPLDEGSLGTLHSLLGSPSHQSFVLLLAAGMVTTFVLKATLALWLTWWSARYVARLQTQTARRLLRAYMSESFLTHRRRNTGELIRNVGTAVADAHTRVLGGLLSVLSSLLSIALIVLLLLVVSPAPTLFAVLYFGTAVLLLQRVLGPANRRAGEQAQHTSWVSSHALVDAMHGFREAVLHNARGYFVDKFDTANRQTAEAAMRANYYSTLPKYLLELVTMVGLTAFIVTTILTGSAEEAMPTMSLFVAATVKMLPLMVSLTATVGMIRVGREGLSITVGALRTLNDGPAPMPQSDSVSLETPRPGGAIELRDVSFRYPDSDADVLSDISFGVPTGSSLALCGISGSGKTTLVNIILGLITPTSGTVTFNNVPTDAAGDAWHDLVAYVPQDVYITDSTLASNVAFGLPPEEHDEAKVRDCLDRAALGGLLESLPDGLETLVGERGTRLSGGQRQRIGIARALYRDPQVLVLDEATSALDNETEHHITKTLAALHGRITTVVVAHRLSTVRDVDSLAFLSEGRVAALGTFRQVVERSPEFAHLVALGKLDGSDRPEEADDLHPELGQETPEP